MAPSPATRTCCSGCAVPGTGGRASMKLAVGNAEGKQVRQITVDDAVFGITPNLAVLHQAFVAQRANQRRGTRRPESPGREAGRTRIPPPLSGKLADGQLHVIDKLGGLTRPKTKEVVSILHNAGIERSALIVTGEPDRSVLISARNLPKTKGLPAPYPHAGA